MVTESASQRHAIRIPYKFLGMGLHRDVLELDNHLNFKLLDGTPDENRTYVAKISFEGDPGQQQPDFDLLNSFRSAYHGVLSRFFPRCVVYFHTAVCVTGRSSSQVSMLVTTRASGDSLRRTVDSCLDQGWFHDAVMAVCCSLIYVMEVQICTVDATGKFFIQDLHAENVTVAKRHDVQRTYEEFCCVDPSGLIGLKRKVIATTTVSTFVQLLMANNATHPFGKLLKNALDPIVHELQGIHNYKKILQAIQNTVVQVVDGVERRAQTPYLQQGAALQLQNLLGSIRRGDTPYSCEPRPFPADASGPSMAGNVAVRTAPAVRSGHGIVPPNSHGIVPNAQPPQSQAAAATRFQQGRMAPPEPMSGPPWARLASSPRPHREGQAPQPWDSLEKQNDRVPQWTRPPRPGKQLVWQRPRPQDSSTPPPQAVWVKKESSSARMWAIARNLPGSTKDSDSGSCRRTVRGRPESAEQKVAEVPKPTTIEPPESVPPVKTEGPAVPKPADKAARQKSAPNKYVAEPHHQLAIEDAALERPGPGSLLGDSITKEEPTEEFDSEEPKSSASSASTSSSASAYASYYSSSSDQEQDAAAASTAPEKPAGGTKRAWADTHDDEAAKDSVEATPTLIVQTGSSSNVAVLSATEQDTFKEQLLEEYRHERFEDDGNRKGRTSLVFQDPAQNALPLPPGAMYDPTYWRTREDSRAQMLLLHQLLRCVFNLLGEAVARDDRLKSHAHLKDFNKFKGKKRLRWLWWRLSSVGIQWMDSQAPASEWSSWATHYQLREAVEWHLWDLLPPGWVDAKSEHHKVFLCGTVASLTSSKSHQEGSIWRHRLANEIALEFGQCVLDLCNTTRFGYPPPQDDIDAADL